MKYRLTKEEYDSIINVFCASPEVEKAILFGSRAKGNFKNGSDIDIVIDGKNISFDDFLKLKIKLYDLDILQKIDLIKFRSIENADFIEHPECVGIIIYQNTRVTS